MMAVVSRQIPDALHQEIVPVAVAQIFGFKFSQNLLFVLCLFLLFCGFVSYYVWFGSIY